MLDEEEIEGFTFEMRFEMDWNLGQNPKRVVKVNDGQSH